MIMKDKVCVITGSNNGFGFVSAQRLTAMGATVLMVCRSRERGEAARAKIAAATGRQPDLYLGDFLLQADVRRVAAEIAARHPKVDVLVNNAGYAFGERALTSEGFERTFALNYLAYFTFSRDLRTLLRASGAGRIINIASSSHRWSDIDLDNLQGEKRFPTRRFPPLPAMYGWSNVCRIMLTYEQAGRYQADGITANCLCPGFVPVVRAGATAFQNWMIRVIPRFMPNARTPEQAAETVVYLASSPAAGTLSGVYFQSGVQMRSSDQTYDPAVRRALWEQTQALLTRVPV
jgi:NAD(P)-dependent dehydrogenase (short-subunit alcohol dehydrogenase family)